MALTTCYRPLILSMGMPWVYLSKGLPAKKTSSWTQKVTVSGIMCPK